VDTAAHLYIYIYIYIYLFEPGLRRNLPTPSSGSNKCDADVGLQIEFVKKLVRQNHKEGMVRRQKPLRTNLNGKKDLEKPTIAKEWPILNKSMQSQEEN
jgi:hypothetical protein